MAPNCGAPTGPSESRFHRETPAEHSGGGLFFNGTPGMAHPVANGFFIPLDGAALGLLGTPAQAMQEATDVIGVIVHMETASNPLRHTWAGPQFGFKTGGLCAAKQIFFQAALNRCGRPGAGRAANARLPRARADAFQRRTLRRSAPTRRATSTGIKPSRSRARARNLRRSNSWGLPEGRIDSSGNSL